MLLVLLAPIVLGLVRSHYRAKARRARQDELQFGDEVRITDTESGESVVYARKIPAGFPAGCDLCPDGKLKPCEGVVEHVTLHLCPTCYVRAARHVIARLREHGGLA